MSLELSSLPDLQYEGRPALPPQEADLKRLYDLIIETRSVTVMEFGCGYSTFIILQALRDNRAWFDGLPEKPEVRNTHLFECHSVDTNLKWAKEVSKKAKIDVYHSVCQPWNWKYQACHTYYALPNVVPDFIYLDGPDPQQVQGDIWKCPERTPMAADILSMESTLIPGTTVLVDGRTNNARFLARNFNRKWKVMESQEHDQTLIILDEPPLGTKVVIGIDILRWLRKNKSES